MIAGHTKFDTNQLFSSIARAFNTADTFNIAQVVEQKKNYDKKMKYISI